MSDEQRDRPDPRLTRRQTLGIAGAAGSAVVLGGGTAKIVSRLAENPDEVSAATAARSCKLTPEVTEGPFYVALDRIRKDITEGRPGVPLTLKLRVVDVKRCAPIHGAAVDVWHCDAGGLYSDESSNGTAGRPTCAASSSPTGRATRPSGRSTPGTTPDARPTFTSRSTSEAGLVAASCEVVTSLTPASSSSRSPRTRASTRSRPTARTPRSERSMPRTASTRRPVEPAPRSI
jgi:hypothetical protein